MDLAFSSVRSTLWSCRYPELARRCGAPRHANAGLHDVGAPIARELALLDQVVGLEVDQHRQIERSPAVSCVS